jgi:hypothetical protein
MVRAHKETKDQRYFEFVQKWIDTRKTSGTIDEQITLGRVILELPAETRQFYLTLARAFGDRAAAGQIDPGDRNRSLRLAVLLGLLSEATQKPSYGEAGLKIFKTALNRAPSKHSGQRETSLDFILLGQAAATYKDDTTVMKTYVLTAAKILLDMKEEGSLWDDPTSSVLNLCGIEAPKRRGALREFVKLKLRDSKSALPAAVQIMAEQELRTLFHDKPRASLLNLQVQLTDFIFERAKQNISFSLDMLRYGVNEAGAYADGSLTAQGGFLMSYRKLNWRYDGSAWPGQ